MAQTRANETKVCQHLMYNISKVFHPNEIQDVGHKEPISEKKLLSGNATWSTKQNILGWDLDTETKTLHIPPHCLECLQQLLQQFLPQHKEAPQCLWQQLLSELWSMMVPGISRRSGCFWPYNGAWRWPRKVTWSLMTTSTDVCMNGSSLQIVLCFGPWTYQS